MQNFQIIIFWYTNNFTIDKKNGPNKNTCEQKQCVVVMHESVINIRI